MSSSYRLKEIFMRTPRDYQWISLNLMGGKTDTKMYTLILTFSKMCFDIKILPWIQRLFFIKTENLLLIN